MSLWRTIPTRWGLWLLPLLALQPLLGGHVPWQGDGLLHLYRVAALEQALAGGDIFPRWLPDLGYGYGFPLFNYYAPFSYYVALPFRWLGMGLPTAVTLSYALALGVMALGAYHLGRELGGERGGITAVLALLYAPYTLINLHHRAALAELWGLAWLVVALWLVQHTAAHPRRWPWLTLAYSALLLSHNITALIGTPVLIVYGFVSRSASQQVSLSASQQVSLSASQQVSLSGSQRVTAKAATTNQSAIPNRQSAIPNRQSAIPNRQSAIPNRQSSIRNPQSPIPLLLGLLLTTFFWLPALGETGYVQIGRVADGANFSYVNHFLDWRELLAGPTTADPLLVNPSLPRALGWGHLALLAYAALTLLWVRPRFTIRLSPVTFFVLLLPLSLFMALPASQWLWDTLPLLPYVQFPWRFLGLAAVALAALLASLGAGTRTAPTGYGWILLPLAALPYLFPSPPPPLPPTADRAALIAFEVDTGWLGTTSAGDYLPTVVAVLPPPNPAPALSRHRQGDQLIFGQFYFPGWQLWVDGQPHPLEASVPHGLLQTTLPSGEHTLELRFGNTPLRTAANGVSLVVWVGVVASQLVSLSASQRVSLSASQLVGRAGGWGVGWVMVGLVVVKGVYLDHAQTVVRRTAEHWPLAIRFEGEMRLLEAAWPSAPIPADEPIPLALVWQAIQPTAELSVGVQLVDERGVRHGQSDHQHPAGLPITRWLPTQYGRDLHALTPLPGTPAGVYALELIVYGTADGRQRAWLNEGGLPVGVRYPLGQVAIAPPRQPTAEEDLPPLMRLSQPTITPEVALLGWAGLPPQAAVGEVLPVVLYWQTRQNLDHTPELAISLRDAQGRVWLRWAGGHGAPQAGWAQGHIGREVRLLNLPALGELGALASGDYQLYVNETAVASLALVAPQRRFEPPAWPATGVVEAAVGEIATLYGVQLSQPDEGTVQVALAWRAEAITPTSYTVFVQLLGGDGRPLAQSDRLPHHEEEPRPTTSWLPHEYVLDTHHLPLPAEPFTLLVGLYDAATGVRVGEVVYNRGSEK